VTQTAVPSCGRSSCAQRSYRHSIAWHTGEGPELERLVTMHRKLDFLAEALLLGAGTVG
jgi:hypothetical protein